MADTMVKHIRRRLKESILAKPAAKKKVGKQRGKTTKRPPPIPSKTDLKAESAAKESTAFLNPKMAQSPSDFSIAASSTAVLNADAKQSSSKVPEEVTATSKILTEEQIIEEQVQALIQGQLEVSLDTLQTFARRVSIFGQPAAFPVAAVAEAAEDEEVAPKIQRFADIIWSVFREDRDLPLSQRRKIVGYCYWSKSFPILQYYLASFDFASVVLDGDMDTETRRKIIVGFQDDRPQHVKLSKKNAKQVDNAKSKHDMNAIDVASVLLMSNAGFEGLNLTRPPEGIVLGGFWTPLQQDQLEGRFLRPGQERTVNVHYLEILGTPDARMKMIVRQKSLFHDLMNIYRVCGIGDSAEAGMYSLRFDLYIF